MPKKVPSPAQAASRFTYFLKGDLKRKEQLFILIAKKLVRVRDEKLWQTLKHENIEEYARERLGMQRSTLYHYLQVHDWLARDHPAWLGRKPRGFIPSLTGASALMWIENRLRDEQPTGERLRLLESMRRQALRGTLTDEEFAELRSGIRPAIEPLRAMLRSLQSLRRRSDAVKQFPAAARAAIDDAIRALEQSIGSADQVATLLAPRAIALARRELEGGTFLV